ncbi:hypothetical protein [Isoptericola aurantiacus]|uniref:hypothetical protein n=1 Tax=Isoptericola aurantiacus TaxID=3377839 RepID=UPI003839FCD1
MSTPAPTADERRVLAARTDARAVRRVQRSVASGTVLIGAGAWVVFLAVAVAVPLIVHNAGNSMDTGVLFITEYIARWIAFGTAVAVFATIVPTHLAAGGTRRALRAGALRAAAIAGIVFGLLKALAFLGERGVFAALGWTWRWPDGVLGADGGGLTLTAVSEGLVVAVYVLFGCAVVAGYQSHGIWRGTLLLLPGLALCALVELVTRSGSAEDVLGRFLDLDGVTAVVVGIVGGLAAVALAAAWLHLHLRTLRLRPTR